MPQFSIANNAKSYIFYGKMRELVSPLHISGAHAIEEGISNSSVFLHSSECRAQHRQRLDIIFYYYVSIMYCCCPFTDRQQNMRTQTQKSVLLMKGKIVSDDIVNTSIRINKIKIFILRLHLVLNPFVCNNSMRKSAQSKMKCERKREREGEMA